MTGTKRKSSRALQTAKAARSDGSLGLALILQAVEHFNVHGDDTGIIKCLSSGTSSDFNRLKCIIESSTNLKVVGDFNKLRTVRIFKPKSFQMNGVFDKLKIVQKSGNISFRSRKVEAITGYVSGVQSANKSIQTELANLIIEAKKQNETEEVIYALEKCWIKIKSLSE